MTEGAVNGCGGVWEDRDGDGSSKPKLTTQEEEDGCGVVFRVRAFSQKLDLKARRACACPLFCEHC